MPASNPYAAPHADLDAPPIAVTTPALPAGRAARLGAQLIDLVLLTMPVMMVSVGAVLSVQAHRPGALPQSQADALLMTLGGVGVALLMLFQLYLLSATGQSLGKRWVGVRIVKLDGSPASFWRVILLRLVLPSLLSWIPYAGWAFFPVNFLFIFADDRRCLHDRIAGTKVVEVPGT
jgi:uncharacterized RDD family membrane protein YckC